MKSLMLAMIVICSGAITPYAEAQFKKQFEGKIKGQF